jgi:type I restriction enzyme S subunit
MPEAATYVPFSSLYEVPSRNGVSYPKRSRGSGVPMVNMRELFAFDRIANQEMERAPLTARELRDCLLQEGDLLFARQSLVREGAGRVVYVDEGPDRTWEGHLIRVRLDHSRALPRYYFYYFRSPSGRAQIETIVEQVAAAGIRGSDLGSLSVLIPTLPHQKAIAEVLSALDDKIEADRQSVASAERLANTLFAKWRHDLDGQETTTFGQVAHVYGGSTPRTGIAEYWSGDHAWAVPRDVTALGAPYLFDTERHITIAGLASIGNRVHPPGSIFMTSRATIGAFAVLQLPCAANQGFIVVVPKDAVFRWFLFHEMRSRVWEMLDLANGSTFLEISRGNFKDMATLLPERADLESLDRLLGPLHGWCASTVRGSVRLAELRDILLPRLFSGELRVRDAEGLVEGAV